jgi:hypothetical protein
MNYCQCTLRKGNREQITWIPEKFAKKGKFLKLKKDNGWEVIEVGHKANEETVVKLANQFKKTRVASDI